MRIFWCMAALVRSKEIRSKEIEKGVDTPHPSLFAPRH
jgi:hypothetical protein